jgi:hypothetical protein
MSDDARRTSAAADWGVFVPLPGDDDEDAAAAVVPLPPAVGGGGSASPRRGLLGALRRLRG